VNVARWHIKKDKFQEISSYFMIIIKPITRPVNVSGKKRAEIKRGVYCTWTVTGKWR
jgi:hypothetical protein